MWVEVVRKDLKKEHLSLDLLLLGTSFLVAPNGS